MNIFNFTMAIIIAAAVSWSFYDRVANEKRIKYELKPGRKNYLVEPLLLPLYLFVIVLVAVIMGGISNVSKIAGAFVVLFLYIGIYYTVLLCVLPLLRRFISARACAALWLLPNLLYFTVYLDISNTKPLILITLPRQWFHVFAIVWMIGFAGVFLWQIISHLLYRKFLLKDVVPVVEDKILSKWNYEQRQHEVRKSIPILYSENTNTPVTIGCFEPTMRLVLPKRSYTEDELELIIKHELHHIKRCDTRTKVFLGFCTAMCWFNPLMWVAKRRISEDLELSCDEAVLEGSDENIRMRYAELLLKTVGDGRGYTTCLSPKASSLRYRLKNVISPGRRFAGGVAVGVAMLALLMGSGSIALSDSGGTVKELIFDNAPEGISIDRIDTYSWTGKIGEYRSIYDWEESALTEYISSLHVKQVYAGSYPERESRQLYVDYAEIADDVPISLTWLEIGDGLLRANIPYDEYGEITYILEDEIDWEYVQSLLDFTAVDPDPEPQTPDMMMYFDYEIDSYGEPEPMYATRKIISKRQGGVNQEVFENDSSIGGVHGFETKQVKLVFSYEPVDDYEIKVENWDWTESYYVYGNELTDNILPLAPYSAHYSVTGRFETVRETVYDMEFVFEVELPE